MVEGADWVYLAASDTAMSELLDVENASDVEGLRRLAQEGKVFRVPNNTSVTVIGRATLLRQVRVTEQGRVYTNREGWIQADFVAGPPPPPPPTVVMPEYRVLDRVGGYLDVLLPGTGVRTPADSLAGLARAIVRAEGATEISLYRTEAAFRANFSASYARQNPNALRDGYLGSWTGGRFTPSPYR